MHIIHTKNIEAYWGLTYNKKSVHIIHAIIQQSLHKSILQIITWKHNQHHKRTNVSLTTFYIVAVQNCSVPFSQHLPFAIRSVLLMAVGTTMVLCQHHWFWWGWHWIQEKLGPALFLSRKDTIIEDGQCMLSFIVVHWNLGKVLIRERQIFQCSSENLNHPIMSQSWINLGTVWIQSLEQFLDTLSDIDEIRGEVIYDTALKGMYNTQLGSHQTFKTSGMNQAAMGRFKKFSNSSSEQGVFGPVKLAQMNIRT